MHSMILQSSESSSFCLCVVYRVPMRQLAFPSHRTLCAESSNWCAQNEARRIRKPAYCLLRQLSPLWAMLLRSHSSASDIRHVRTHRSCLFSAGVGAVFTVDLTLLDSRRWYFRRVFTLKLQMWNRIGCLSTISTPVLGLTQRMLQ